LCGFSGKSRIFKKIRTDPPNPVNPRSIHPRYQQNVRFMPPTQSDYKELTVADLPLFTVLLVVDSLHFIFARALLPHISPMVSAMYVIGIATVRWDCTVSTAAPGGDAASSCAMCAATCPSS